MMIVNSVRPIKVLLLFFSLLAIASLGSCKKDKKTPTPAAAGTMTATIDGNAANFSKYTNVLTGSVNGSEFTAIEGIASDNSTFTITVYGTLTAGEVFTSNDPDPGNKPILLYVQGTNNYMNALDNPSVNVKITAVSASSIQGTFSGTITEMTSGNTRVIADGKFNVPRQ